MLLIIFIGFISSISFGALSISPAPVSNEINLNNQSNTDIYLTNTSSTPVLMNVLISSAPGFSISINRCTGKTLGLNQNCYVRISLNTNQTPIGTSQVSLSNSSVALVSLKNTKVISSVTESSEFTTSSDTVTDFSVRTIYIRNKTLSQKSYSPLFSGADASKFSISVNRCSNIAPNTQCSVTYKLNPQQPGSFSATMIESQITSSSIFISATIAPSTIGSLPAPSSSIAVSVTSLDYGTLSRYGQSVPQIVTLQNTGNTILTPILSFSPKMELALNRCATIDVGSSCALSLSINPTNDMSNGPITGQSVLIKANLGDIGQPISIIANLLFVSSCPVSQHFEINSCVSNTLACAISNGSGTQLWSSGSWGTCQNLSCDSGYALDMTGLSCTVADFESSFAEQTVGSQRTIDNGIIIHSIFGSELTRPASNNGITIWSSESK